VTDTSATDDPGGRHSRTRDVETFEIDVERGKIREFARAVKDDNPTPRLSSRTCCA
jgi:uncharacterized protein YbaA (DUF1428 family)